MIWGTPERPTQRNRTYCSFALNLGAPVKVCGQILNPAAGDQEIHIRFRRILPRCPYGYPTARIDDGPAFHRSIRSPGRGQSWWIAAPSADGQLLESGGKRGRTYTQPEDHGGQSHGSHGLFCT